MGMCTKAEVQEVFDNGIKVVLERLSNLTKSITKMEGRLEELPCTTSKENMLELKFQHQQYDKDITSLQSTRDDLYKKVRDQEKTVTTLVERSENQKEWSAKTWVIILSVITVTLNALFRFL